MSYQLTPGAQRALEAAAGWTSRDDATGGLQPAELLLGLLEQTECRAARLLAERSVTPALVQSRWPQLKRRTPAPSRVDGELSSIGSLIDAALNRLVDHPRPLVLATEHLLLGLLASTHEVALWLAEQGLSADETAAYIDRLYGLSHDVQAIETLLETQGADPVRAGTALYSDERAGLLRIIDAAGNRAREALRVIEDYVRFGLDDTRLTAELKQVRHELCAALSGLIPGAALAARDTEGDVGTGLSTAWEARRDDMQSVLTANFKRLEEALRSLEEYGKLIDPELSRRCKAWRYRSYTLERTVGLASSAAGPVCLPRLCVLVSGCGAEADFGRGIEALLAAGVRMIQLREKRLDDRSLVGRARLAARLVKEAGGVLIVNDRADVAAAAGADGVHLGQSDLPVRDARRILGRGALIGVSTHSVEQARQAMLDGADYIGAGPTFASRTKQFNPGELQGTALLRAVAAEIRRPAFAIGGICQQNLDEVLSTGFTRVAVGSAVVAAADPSAAAAWLLSRLSC